MRNHNDGKWVTHLSTDLHWLHLFELGNLGQEHIVYQM